MVVVLYGEKIEYFVVAASQDVRLHFPSFSPGCDFAHFLVDYPLLGGMMMKAGVNCWSLFCYQVVSAVSAMSPHTVEERSSFLSPSRN